MRHSNRGTVVLLALVLALVVTTVLYVASVGPFIWLADRDLLDQAKIEHLYAPLGFASKRSPPVKRTLDQYISLFRGPVPSRDYPALNSY